MFNKFNSSSKKKALKDDDYSKVDNKFFWSDYAPEEDEVNPAFSDLADPDVLWEMTKGLLNSTGVTYGGNRTFCEDNVIDIDTGFSRSGVLLTRGWFDYLNFLNGVDEMLLVGQSLNGITYECYYGAYESYYVVGNYTDVF